MGIVFENFHRILTDLLTRHGRPCAPRTFAALPIRESEAKALGALCCGTGVPQGIEGAWRQFCATAQVARVEGFVRLSAGSRSFVPFPAQVRIPPFCYHYALARFQCQFRAKPSRLVTVAFGVENRLGGFLSATPIRGGL